MVRFIFFFLCHLSSTLLANFESYDEIVDKLSKYGTTEKIKTKKPTFKKDIPPMVHMGLGLTQSFFGTHGSSSGVPLADQSPTVSIQNQGGVMINLGVDVLNRNWGLEGSYANFGIQETEDRSLQLREFAIKGVYKPLLSSTWTLRTGVGMSARFLDIISSGQNQINQSHKTPSGLFFLALDNYLTPFVSVGADLGLKTALIEDTIDRASVDLTFRVDTHF